MKALDGVLPVDKPSGPTSHDMVAVARRHLRLRRIGHTGTLDPFASGLLLLCLGRSTRLAEYLTALPKRYTATMRLGVETETDDLEGSVIREDEGWTSLTRENVEAVLDSQVGDRLQRPPRYSAKKIGGQRAYALARRGGDAELPPVPVRIERIEVTRFEPPEVDFEVDCSSGTYIRAIARDAGADLGVGAHLSALRRTRIGPHSVDTAISPEQFDDRSVVSEAVLRPAEALSHLPRIVLMRSEVERLTHGRPIGIGSGTDTAPDVPIVLVDESAELIAVGRASDGEIRPMKVFA